MRNGPILVHVVTQKGKGYGPAEISADKFHGVGKFNVVTGAQEPSAAGTPPSFTKVFANALIEEARADDKIVAVTAAMPSGTGLDRFAEMFPKRCFDVGIAEQHAVTFAAGLAAEGYKPFAAIYSTFLQRAYDQVVHDVAVQGLPVRFAVDRAGLVGADGPTHAGAFDVAYLSCLPGIVVMAAADELELIHMVATAAALDDRPSAFRYPRGEGTGIALPKRGTPLPIGKGRVLREGSAVALLSLGARLPDCLIAAEQLAGFGLPATVADARFAKPLDMDLDPPARSQSRGARSPWRKGRPAASAPRCSRRLPARDCSTVCSKSARSPCPTASSSRTSRTLCMRKRVSMRPALSPACSQRSARMPMRLPASLSPLLQRAVLAEALDRLGAAVLGERGGRVAHLDGDRALLAQHREHGLDLDVARLAEDGAARIVTPSRR